MSSIQLPYGFVNKPKEIRFDLPKNFEENFYYDQAPYLTNHTPEVENKLISLIKNRDDLKKWLLATSPYGEEIQQDLNAVVGHDEKFNHAIVRHALDLKDESIFRNPNAFNVTFYDMKKFDQVNPVIGKLAAQVRASQLTEKELNQKLLDKFEADQIQARLDRLRYGDKNDDNDDDDNDGGPEGGTPGKQITTEDLEKKLARLRGNKKEHSVEQFINQRINEINRLREETKGNVGRKRDSIAPHLKFRLPETPPATPEDLYWEGVASEWIPNNLPLSGPPAPFIYDERDFPPLPAPGTALPAPGTHLPPLPSVTPTAPSFYSTPLPPISSDVPQSISPLRNKLPSLDPFPSLPNINDFSRPITELVDTKDNTIEITPKRIDLPPIGQKQLSKELNQIFPDVDTTIKEKQETFKERTENIKELIEKVGDADQNSQLTFQFEFFQGGENAKFNSFMNNFGLTEENQKFIEFLQSEYCRKIFETNNLKIHIETGNIYYQDRDTNESIFHFIQNQQNTTKGFVQKDFKFSSNYKDYFQWILNQFDAHEKTNYDLLSFQNTKFLVYRYNDILLSGGNEIIKIRHSQLTNDYLAAAEIQNQDWQYFIERILEVSTQPNSINPQEAFLKNTIENITVAKKIYKMLFDTIANNFNLIIPDLSAEKIQDISEHFYLKKYSYSQSVTDLNDWVSFYYSYGKFPGSSQELITIPYAKNPYFLKTDEHLSPAVLHQKFYNSDLLGLSSFQALCALNIYLGGSKEVSGLAYSEFLQNMTYQALTQENDSVQLSFAACFKLGHSIVTALNELVKEEQDLSFDIGERVNNALEVTFKIKEEESEKFIEEKSPLTSTPLSKQQLNQIYEQEKEDYLKTAMQINAEGLNAIAERDKIDNEKLYQEIVNPNPGLVVDNKLETDNQSNDNLSNSTQKRLDKTLEEARAKINATHIVAPILDITPNDTFSYSTADSIEDIYIDDSYKDQIKTINFPLPSTDDRKDFKLNLKTDEMVVFDSPFLETSISIERNDLNNILQNIAEDLDSNLQTLDMTQSEETETRQKKLIVKNLILRLDKTPNKNIEKQLKSQKWLQSLVDDQLRIDNIHTFGNYTNDDYQNKLKRTPKKQRMLAPMTWMSSEEPSIDKIVPTNKRKAINSAKKIFSNIIKNVPPESYKKFKIEYSPQDSLQLMDEDEF